MARKNKNLNPKARGALNRLKYETANEVGIQLSEGNNGDIKSEQAGQVGGNMVKKMIQAYENEISDAGYF